MVGLAAHVEEPVLGAATTGADAPADTVRVVVPDNRWGHGYRHPILRGSIKVADGVAVILALLVASWFKAQPLAQDRALAAASLACMLVFLLFPKRDALLDVPRVFLVRSQIRYLLLPLIACDLVGFGVLVALGWPIGHAVQLWSERWVGVVGAVGLERWLSLRLLSGIRRRGRLARKIAIIGGGPEAFRLAQMFRTSGRPAFELIGVFDDGRTVGEAPVDSSIADLVTGSRERQLDGIIIAIPRIDGHEQQVTRLVWQLRSVLADVYIMPQLVHGIDTTMPIEIVGPAPLMVLKRRPLNEWQMVSKAALDLGICLILLAMLLPVLVLVAILIKLDSPGPVLFQQRRLGFNNRDFTVFKFRSMYADMTDATATRQTARDDPRVTRVGRWIRRLSIDELPQLINVMRGEMSLVGPRPHAPHTRAAGELLDDALAEYAIRHQVKPGITGWAQVNGSRGELITFEDLRRRVELDLDYIHRWSMWLDIKIMMLTLSREIVSRHAF